MSLAIQRRVSPPPPGSLEAVRAPRSPYSPFTDKLFRTGLGRLPTATERRDVEGLAARLAGQGKHVFEIGAVLSGLMTLRPDFRARNPHAATFERVFKAELGRAPKLEEYNKLTQAMKDARASGRPFNPGQLTTFLVRLTPEYKKRVAIGAAYVQALQNAATSVDGYVNGQPSRITVSSVGNGKFLRTDAANAFNRMKADAARAGINLSVVSGFRTMDQQRYLYSLYLSGRGNLAARPGYSNHQGGTSADLSVPGGYSSSTYRWLSANARRYGFVNDVNGEPWHWTYRG